ncbi:calcium-binding protein [Algirhabdus cladophorae]|uniref:calcium-binding protein n=1 Tax=Algirhabdus cladophorae TaxID=3377108 RepID=UPI003B849B56
MPEIITFSQGGSGIQVDAAGSDDVFIYSDIELYSTNDSVVVLNGNSDLFISPHASVVSFSSSSSEPAISLGGTDVGRNAVVISEGASVFGGFGAIGSAEDYNDVTNYGTLTAGSSAVDLTGIFNRVENFGEISGSNTIGVRVFGSGTINNFGSVVSSQYALVLRDGSGTIVNSGTAQADTAVYMGGSSAQERTNELNNTGEVLGENYGVYSTSESAVIVNSGVISNSTVSSSYAAIRTVNSDLTETMLVINSGTISSPGVAYFGQFQEDKIINTGTIFGLIRLEDGDDIYRGKSGEVIGEILAGNGNDLVIGGAEDNTIIAQSGANELRGGGGDDFILSGSDGSSLYGGSGNDTLTSGDDDDFLYGHNGDDILNGGGKRDMLYGGRGDDTLDGSFGIDQLYGGAGKDILRGGIGNDMLAGGHDDDTLDGGSGNDVFVFNRNAGNDVILDFKQNADQIDISALGLRPADYNGIITDALSNAGNNATLLDLDALGGSGSILIEGLNHSDVALSDFIL